MDPQTVGGVVGGILLAAYAAWQTVRAGLAEKKAEHAKVVAVEATASAGSLAASDLAKSNADLANAYKSQAEEWKVLAEKLHKEHQEYRQWVHDKAKEDNAIVLNLTAENADLKARTDLTPLLEQMQKHDKNAERVAETLTGLANVVQSLVARLTPDFKTE